MLNNDFDIIDKYDDLMVTIKPEKTVFVIPNLTTVYNNKVDKTQTIAGIDLQDNITDTQLRTALAINNVDNTSDIDKPVSIAQAAAVTTLDASKVNKTMTIAGIDLQNNITDTELKAALDIDNVNNTSDADKPVSTAQATALGLKVDKTTKIAGEAIGTGISKADLLTALNVADGAEVNVNPDWNAVSGAAQILNKPTTISGYGITDAYTKTEVDTKMSVVYRYKGSKTTYEELPTTGQEVGDTYNIVNAHTTAPVFGAGSNLTWNGTGWDILSGDLAHKADKVLAATEDNFVAFDGGGNIKDSGKKATDFLLTTDISAWAKAANKPSYNSGEITYDKTASGMSATDVKAAIDELNSDKLSKADKYTAPIDLEYDSTNNYWDWDYSDGDNALIEMSGSEPTTDIEITNVIAGDIGVVTVKGGQLTLPENSILSSDFGYLAAIGNQYYRYTFYFNGTTFEWHRSVIGDE